MDLLIISDLHIESAEDRLLNSLNLLLTWRAKPGDRLVLAGDIFDLYVGNKRCFRDEFRSFHHALRIANDRGVRIDYIEGNHDFFLKEVFREFEHVKVHSKDVLIESCGQKFFISHGDLANQSDFKYRGMRMFLRNPLMRAFVLLSPGHWIQRVGMKSSYESRSSRSDACQNRLNELRRVYRNYAAEKLMKGFDYVVMGHCHDLDEIRFKLGERVGVYFNVGYPRVHGSFLCWSQNDKKMTRQPLPTHPVLVKSSDWNSSKTLSY